MAPVRLRLPFSRFRDPPPVGTVRQRLRLQRLLSDIRERLIDVAHSFAKDTEVLRCREDISRGHHKTGGSWR
jgi:hypothetical protein